MFTVLSMQAHGQYLGGAAKTLFFFQIWSFGNLHVAKRFGSRQSLLSLHMTKSYVRTATRSTLKVEAI